MALARHALTETLFQYLQDQLGDVIKTFTMVDVGGEGIPQAKMPYLVLRNHGAEAQIVGEYEPPMWRMRYSLAIYMMGPANEDDPDADLERIVGKVEAAMERQDGDPAGAWWTTMGGTCLRVYPFTEALDAGEPGNLKIAVIGLELVALPPARGRPDDPP